MQTIAIVGGGFSGTMTAVNLSRMCDHSLRVVIVNSLRPLGRGTAYGTTRAEHLLNVAARNMSALPDFPSHFVDWLRSRSEFSQTPDAELREVFVPRRIYGDYLSGLLSSCLEPIDARCKVTVQTINAQAVDVIVNGNDQATLLLDSGESVEADRVVLATGNQPPGSFRCASALNHDDRYCGDPWNDDTWQTKIAQLTKGRPPIMQSAGVGETSDLSTSPRGCIVLLGTGLTMVDVVLTLSKLGWDGSIVAVSRHGMLPKSHFRGIAYQDYLPNDAESLGLNGLVEIIEQHCNRLRQMSQNPAIAIDKLRPHTQRLWRSLSKEEKQDFLCRYAATWNVTRHRIAASVHDVMTDALDTGRLRVIPGTIEQLESGEQSIGVLLRDGDGNVSKQSGDLVINCTGPQSHFSQTRLPLFDNLLRRGLVCCDPLDMGIQVDDEFAVIDEDGNSTNLLYAIGPLLKGSLWETTAVPELRGQAMRVAEILLQREPGEIEEEDVIEYYI